MNRQQRIDRLKTEILELLSKNEKYRASEIWDHFDRHYLVQPALDELLDQQSISREEFETEIHGTKLKIYHYFV